MTSTAFQPEDTKRAFYAKLIRLTLPIMIQSLMLALVAVADALMLGNIEQNAMSAVTLATQIQFIQNMLVTSVVSTASILGAQYWGKNDIRSLQDVFHIALRMTAIISILFFLACEFCPGFLMRIFTNEDVLVQIGIRYLRVAGWSYLLVGTSQSFLALMKVSEHVRSTAIISCMTVILNIIFNAVFIYGWFGLPKMEAEGAALSTVMVRIIEFLVCIGLSFRSDYTAPDWKHLFTRNALLFKDYIKCLLPLVGACMLWGIGFTSYTAFMGHLGTDAAAANSITSVVRDCVCCMCDGAAVGGGIMVGNELGAGNLERGKAYGIRIMKLSYVVGLLSTVIMLLLIVPITHVVKLTPEALQLLYGMMAVMAFYMIGRSVNTVIINGIFASGGDTLFDMYSLAVVMWCLAIPLAALGTFLFHWGPVLVYACTCLDEVGKIPWTMIHFRKYKWVKDLTRERVE